MCAEVLCTIIDSFCVTICAANNQTKLITIEQSNCIAFSIAIYSTDRQTKLDSIDITISFSQHNSVS